MRLKKKFSPVLILIFCTLISISSIVGYTDNLDLEHGQQPIYSAKNYTIYKTGNISVEDLKKDVRQISKNFHRNFAKFLPNRYAGKPNVRIIEGRKLVAYGFILFPNGEFSQYHGYCSEEHSAEESQKIIQRSQEWKEMINERLSNIKTSIDLKTAATDPYKIGQNRIDTTDWPLGDYSYTEELFYDDDESDSSLDYFFIKTRFSMEPGIQEYGTVYANRYAIMKHIWNANHFELDDAVPTTHTTSSQIGASVSVSVDGPSARLAWSTSYPSFSIQDLSDFNEHIAEWKGIFDAYKDCGRHTFTIKPGSKASIDQSWARSQGYSDDFIVANTEYTAKWFSLVIFATYTSPTIYGGFSVYYSGNYMIN